MFYAFNKFLLIKLCSAEQPQSRRNAQALLGDKRTDTAKQFHLVLLTALLTEGETEAQGGCLKPGSYWEAKLGSETFLQREIRCLPSQSPVTFLLLF